MNPPNIQMFFGTAPTRLGTPSGAAAHWHMIKGMCGNLHPGACEPFGRMSCCAYSGAYPTGYGRCTPNSGGEIRPMTADATVCGFSHMQHSGTGAIRNYYNFAVVTPLYGALRDVREPLTDESARPGDYRCTMGASGIRAELTVSGGVALHRYTMQPGSIRIDFSNDGLNRNFGSQLYECPSASAVRRVNTHTAVGWIDTHGLRKFIAADCTDAADCALWRGNTRLDASALQLDATDDRFGCVFTVSGPCVVRVAISLRGESEALAMLERAPADFDTARDQTVARWAAHFAAVDVECDSDADRDLFYTLLYRASIKPCDWSGDNFLGDTDDFVCDLATMWDQYKTALPLIFTLYPEISRKIAHTMTGIARRQGEFPNCVLLDGGLKTEQSQAKLLMILSLADAHLRGIPVEADSAVTVLMQQLRSGAFDLLLHAAPDAYPPHILDLAEVCAAGAMLAHSVGRTDDEAALCRMARCWTAAFDAKTGLLRPESYYYEGNVWNYSFRLLPQLDERVAQLGKDRFTALLDYFFGFGENPTDCAVPAAFEGFNNEPDMETPYAYLYADRPDRLRDVLSLGFAHSLRFPEPGGFPGNDDSGGLSSCLLWNMLGIFPVSGQDQMLLGIPRIRNAALHLSTGRTLTITRRESRTPVWYWNGVPTGTRLLVSELMRGGTLTFQ